MAGRGIICFVGPSLHGARADSIRGAEGEGGIELLPPVRRGDLARLVAERAPSTIAIIDGTFYSYPSVGHAEIGQAIRAGWSVWGLSSMGAIRASEMARCGMRGFGSVYSRFCADPDFGDDEVALLHGAEAPYAPLSEPMIHIREFIGHLVTLGALDEVDAAHCVRSLKERWFGERTLAAVRALVRPRVSNLHAFDLAFADIDAFRTKPRDVATFFAEKPWCRP